MNSTQREDPSRLFDGLIFDRINPVVEKIVGFLFRKIDFDAESLATLQRLGDESVVFASFHTSNLSLLVLYNLLKRNNLKTPRFAMEYNPFMLQSFKYVLRRLSRPLSFFTGRISDEPVEPEIIERMLEEKQSILFSLISRRYFLRRYMETRHDSLVFLVRLQQKMDRPIFLLPKIIFWNMNPERTDSLISSKPTGNRGLISGWVTTTKSLTPSFVRIASPLNMKDEIANSGSDDAQFIASALRNKLLEIYHFEKRSVLGPVIKPRQVMMERVLYHKNVLSEIEALAREKGISEQKLKKKAYKYFMEISADFHMYMIKFLRVVLNYIFNKIYDGISYDPEAIAMIREATQKGPLVITPCHKSHMDYLIMSFLLHENKLIPPHIAGGVNLSFFPMGFIFRNSGAFFLRRSFKGLDLYPTIFKQYVKNLVYEGYPIEFFIEGGRTRTGKPALPKYGFLNYLIEAIEEGYNKDLVFVPVSINYDRILEEASYLQELRGKEKEKESFKALMEGRKLLKRKYGKVYVSINRPFTLREIEGEDLKGQTLPEAISMRVIQKINQATMVTPYALVSATILLLALKGFPRQLLKERLASLYDYLKYFDAILSDSLRNRDNLGEIEDTVIATFLEDKILEKLTFEGESPDRQDDGFFIIREENRPRIIFYKNSIINYFLPIAFYGTALLHLNKKGDITADAVFAGQRAIKELFSQEFIYDPETDETVRRNDRLLLDFLVSNSLITLQDGRIAIEERSVEVLQFFARIIRDFLESYYVAASTIVTSRWKQVGKKELTMEARKSGIKMYHTGDITLSESLSLPNYNNAFAYLESHGWIRRKDVGKKQPDYEIIAPEEIEKMLDRIRDYLSVM